MTNRPGDRHVLHPGDKVMATDGYSMPGIVLSRFIMTDGEIRYAVEHRVEGGKIPLIYADKNLELVERGFEGKREDTSDAEVKKVREALANLIDDVQKWCDAVDADSSWDGWDDHYKALAYGNLDAYRRSLPSERTGQ